MSGYNQGSLTASCPFVSFLLFYTLHSLLWFYMAAFIPGRLNIYFRIAYKFKDCIESISVVFALHIKFKDWIESIFVVLD